MYTVYFNSFVVFNFYRKNNIYNYFNFFREKGLFFHLKKANAFDLLFVD